MDVDSAQLSADDLIAVRVLDDMRNGVNKSKDLSGLPVTALPLESRFNHYSDIASSQPTPSLSIASSSSRSTISETPEISPDEDETFVSRVSNLPIIHTALQAYVQGKASSRVVKYGAEMMEGTVKTMTRPVIDRLPVNQLDEFACRQLDRFGRYGGARSEDATPMQIEASASESSLLNSPQSDVPSPRGRKHLFLNEISTSGSRESSMAASERGRSVSSPRPQNDTHWQTMIQMQDTVGQEVQVVNRSKWQAVLLEAGGIGAAVSEESMKRLKYCLQWLQYATTHIDQQILVLRSFIISISPNNLSSSSTSEALVPFKSLHILSQVKKELVSTIRQVVDVVSKYAGSALPEQARASVRSFILMLPERWASAARSGADDVSASYPPNQQGMTGGAATMAATRVLTLATESLDMMRSVTGVFKESLDRAEAWVDRLQQLGLQRQQQQRLPNPEWGTSSLHAVAAMRDNSSPAPPLYPFRNGNVIAESDARTPSASYRYGTRSPSPSTRPVSEAGDATETESQIGLEERDDSSVAGSSISVRRRSTRKFDRNQVDDTPKDSAGMDIDS